MKADDFVVLGLLLRERRMQLYAKDRAYSLRQVSLRIGIEPSYLSKVERGERAPLSEEKLMALAKELNLNSDELIAMAGGIPRDIADIIRKRPRLFSMLVKALKDSPDHVLVSIIREVRDN
jgi:transcriptional regulator with XRE-family HTH domain